MLNRESKLHHNEALNLFKAGEELSQISIETARVKFSGTRIN